MLRRLYGTCKNISFIKNIAEGLDLCDVTIDFDCLKIFYNISDLMEFINERVEYVIRPDYIDGRQEIVICELAKISTIQTVKSIENIKLIPEGNKRTVCNFSSSDLRYGEFYAGRVAYLSSYELGSSRKAKWIDCTLIDSDSKEFNLRIFTKAIEGNVPAEELIETFVGHYVEFDLEVTKFGNQTTNIVALNQEVELSPEVEVAKRVINNVIENDTALASYNNIYNIVNNLLNRIDGEPGYTLVRMASEIYMINAIDNISTDLDIRAMKRAVICSRGYALPHVTKWSKPLLNNNKIMKIPELKADRELLLIIDVLSEELPSSTKLTYLKIRGLVNDIINIRRGIVDEETTNAYTNTLSKFNGLL